MTNLYFFHLHACYSIFQNFFCAGIQFFVVLNSYDNEIKNMLRTKQIKRKKKYTLDDIDLMSGTEFEEFVSTLFRQMGYNTKTTQKQDKIPQKTTFIC